MSDRSQIWTIAILGVCSIAVGCKGGASGTTARKDPHVSAQSSEPPRGNSSVHRSSRREVPALAIPQNAAYFTEQSEASPAVSVRPQHTCPIDGNSLGNSGTPVTVTLKGEPVFVCCESCAKKAQKDPDKVLARVREEIAARD